VVSSSWRKVRKRFSFRLLLLLLQGLFGAKGCRKSIWHRRHYVNSKTLLVGEMNPHNRVPFRCPRPAFGNCTVAPPPVHGRILRHSCRIFVALSEETVLGITISSRRIIVIFKPPISAIQESGEYPFTRQFAEQVSLTHEFGHAIGLVGDGIPAGRDHHDSDHGAHCTYEDCVMNYALRAGVAIAPFVKRVVSERNAILFDLDCTGDIRAVTPGYTGREQGGPIGRPNNGLPSAPGGGP
jgi:hypothetical protein